MSQLRRTRLARPCFLRRCSELACPDECLRVRLLAQASGLWSFLRVRLVVELDVVELVLMYAHRNDPHHHSSVLVLQLESQASSFQPHLKHSRAVGNWVLMLRIVAGQGHR